MCSLLCCTHGKNEGRSADGNITTGINMAKCCPALLINDDVAAFPTHDPIQFTNEKRVWTPPITCMKTAASMMNRLPSTGTGSGRPLSSGSHINIPDAFDTGCFKIAKDPYRVGTYDKFDAVFLCPGNLSGPCRQGRNIDLADPRGPYSFLRACTSFPTDSCASP